MNFFPTVPVNYLAVLAAAASAMVVGFLWFGPLFGKTWIKLSGLKMGGNSQMTTLYGGQYVTSVVTAYILAVFLGLTGATNLEAALPVAAWVWLGFQATLQLGTVLWEGKSWNLYFLNAGQSLVSLLVMAAVLTYVK